MCENSTEIMGREREDETMLVGIIQTLHEEDEAWAKEITEVQQVIKESVENMIHERQEVQTAMIEIIQKLQEEKQTQAQKIVDLEQKAISERIKKMEAKRNQEFEKIDSLQKDAFIKALTESFEAERTQERSQADKKRHEYREEINVLVVTRCCDVVVLFCHLYGHNMKSGAVIRPRFRSRILISRRIIDWPARDRLIDFIRTGYRERDPVSIGQDQEIAEFQRQLKRLFFAFHKIHDDDLVRPVTERAANEWDDVSALLCGHIQLLEAKRTQERSQADKKQHEYREEINLIGAALHLTDYDHLVLLLTNKAANKWHDFWDNGGTLPMDTSGFFGRLGWFSNGKSGGLILFGSTVRTNFMTLSREVTPHITQRGQSAQIQKFNKENRGKDQKLVEFLHQVLAPRNKLVDKKMVCKVDFGLSRGLKPTSILQDFFEGEYFSKTCKFPWIGSEAIKYRTFTTASDAWSSGILFSETVWVHVHKGCRLFSTSNDNWKQQKILKDQEIDELKQQNHNLKQKLDELIQQDDNWKQQKILKDQEIDELKQQNDNWKQQKIFKDQEIDELKQQLNSMRNVFREKHEEIAAKDETIQELLAGKQALIQKIVDLEQKDSDELLGTNHFPSDVTSTSLDIIFDRESVECGRCPEYWTKIVRLQEKLMKGKEKRQVLEQENETLTRQLDGSRETANLWKYVLVEEARDLRRKDKRDLEDKYKQEIAVLNDKIHSLENDNNSLNKKVCEQKREHEMVEQNILREGNAEKKTLQSKISALEIENSSLAEKITEAAQQRAALDAVKAQLETVTDERETARTQFNQLQTYNGALLNLISQFRRRLQDLEDREKRLCAMVM